MEHKIFEPIWWDYYTSVYPVGASRVQRQEVRRAFYGGAHALFTLLATVIAPGKGDPTAIEVKAVEILDRELEEFKEAVKRGEA
jgi:hypothetical protein